MKVDRFTPYGKNHAWKGSGEYLNFWPKKMSGSGYKFCRLTAGFVYFPTRRMTPIACCPRFQAYSWCHSAMTLSGLYPARGRWGAEGGRPSPSRLHEQAGDAMESSSSWPRAKPMKTMALKLLFLENEIFLQWCSLAELLRIYRLQSAGSLQNHWS